MYARSFGLKTSPFSMTPDPAFLYVTPQYREALVALAYAVLGRKGFVVLTGEAGIGKTTLLVKVLKSVPMTQLQFSVIVNPTLTPSEFLEMVLLDFGVKDIPSSKAQRLWKLQNLLFAGRSQGKVSALIVDEAHKLSHEVLEEIRLLGNFEETQRKLLQIVLVGQDELDEILNRDDLRQLKQRIAIRMSLHPLAPTEVAQYIQHRWTVAGGGQAPFNVDALRAVAAASRGIPRVINSLSENSLMLAFAEGSAVVESMHVEAAAADLQLTFLPHHNLPGLEFPPSPENLSWADDVFAEVLAHIVEDGSADLGTRRVKVMADSPAVNASPIDEPVTGVELVRAPDSEHSAAPGSPYRATLTAALEPSPVPGFSDADATGGRTEGPVAGSASVMAPASAVTGEPPNVPDQTRPGNGPSDGAESELRTLGFFTLARYQRTARRGSSRNRP